jgi:hypothetical protein
MFQKAASMRYLAAQIPSSDPLHKLFIDSSKLHSDKAISLMFDSGYGGAHWLASFAIFYFSGANP